MVHVFRKAVFMEDEGREHYIRSFYTTQEAILWIKSQEGEYFSPNDYYIA